MINCPLCNEPLILLKYKNYCKNISIPEERPHYSISWHSHFEHLYDIDGYKITLYPFQLYYYRVSYPHESCDVHYLPKEGYQFYTLARSLKPIKFTNIPEFMNKLYTIKNFS